MDYEKYKNLLILIFEKTFEIKRNKNKERGGKFVENIGSHQLGKTLELIDAKKPLGERIDYSEILRNTIVDFYNHEEFDLGTCIEKTNKLFELLNSKGYFDNTDIDITNKCDDNTIFIYKTLLLDIWDYYYQEYIISINEEKDTETVTYSVPVKFIDEIVINFKRTIPSGPIACGDIPAYISEITSKYGARSADKYVDWIYTNYFKRTLEEDGYDVYTTEEKKNFIKALYSISDILDKIHHEDSYMVNLAILNFNNKFYGKNYAKASVEELRHIQGCIYAIGIENSDKSLIGNMRLSNDVCLVKIESSFSTIKREKKLEMCIKALKALLNHKLLVKLDNAMSEELFLDRYEKKLIRHKDILDEDIEKLTVLTFIYSNIAACYMQLAKIANKKQADEYFLTCEDYHEYSSYIRKLIIRINEKMHGDKSGEFRESINLFVAFLNSLAYRLYLQKKYADVIIIRSIIYYYYIGAGNKGQANTQIELMPVDLYEKQRGDALLYNDSAKSIQEKYGIDFSYITSKPLMEYEDIIELKTNYNRYKELKRKYE